MTRIIDEQGSGKTKKLMKLAQENNAIFVCENPSAMRYKAKAYGLGNIEFVSYIDFITEDYQDEKFVIDEIEHFLISALATYKNIVGYSLTTGD